MSAKSSLYKKLLEGNNLLVAGVLLLMLVALGVILGNTLFTKGKAAPITEDQIMIQKGGNTIIVNKNGLIEYRSGNNVFYKTWDSTRISYFFTRMQNTARDYIKQGITGPCDGCYAVTLYVDGKLVTIYVSDDQDLNDAFNDFPSNDDSQSVDLSDFFNNDDNGNGTGDDQGGGGVTPTPTLVPGSNLTPTPTSFYQGIQDNTNYPPVQAGCATWSQDIIDKAIISNTLCTVVP